MECLHKSTPKSGFGNLTLFVVILGEFLHKATFLESLVKPQWGKLFLSSVKKTNIQEVLHKVLDIELLLKTWKIWVILLSKLWAWLMSARAGGVQNLIVAEADYVLMSTDGVYQTTRRRFASKRWW